MAKWKRCHCRPAFACVHAFACMRSGLTRSVRLNSVLLVGSWIVRREVRAQVIGVTGKYLADSRDLFLPSPGAANDGEAGGAQLDFQNGCGLAVGTRGRN